MQVHLPALTAAEKEAWPLLFELHKDVSGWCLVGAQMVIVHAAAHGVARPTATRDMDVLVDVQTARTEDVSAWLERRGIKLDPRSIDTFNVGHRFRRGHLVVDVLATDRAGPRANRTTVRPAQTVEVPGGRGASRRVEVMTIVAGSAQGQVPIPDWIGALSLKARAAEAFAEQRNKHLGDLALLLGLPTDVQAHARSATSKERRRIVSAARLIDDNVLAGVAGVIDPRNLRAAVAMLGQ